MTLFVKDRQFDPERPLFFTGARLYILMRTDIPQMNPGKLGAQAAHAGTQFVFDVLKNGDESLRAEMEGWAEQGGGGFGTKITLAATETQILDATNSMEQLGYQAGLVTDPTYPMTNYFGEFFTRSELTCGYVFMPHTVSAAVLDELKEFDLHP
jgi:peptidyl-tRNA hydrolase